MLAAKDPIAMALYEQEQARLPDAEREALFFRTEEIRWSLDMKDQADAQRITNEFDPMPPADSGTRIPVAPSSASASRSLAPGSRGALLC